MHHTIFKLYVLDGLSRLSFASFCGCEAALLIAGRVGYGTIFDIDTIPIKKAIIDFHTIPTKKKKKNFDLNIG